MRPVVGPQPRVTREAPWGVLRAEMSPVPV